MEIWWHKQDLDPQINFFFGQPPETEVSYLGARRGAASCVPDEALSGSPV